MRDEDRNRENSRTPRGGVGSKKTGSAALAHHERPSPFNRQFVPSPQLLADLAYHHDAQGACVVNASDARKVLAMFEQDIIRQLSGTHEDGIRPVTQRKMGGHARACDAQVLGEHDWPNIRQHESPLSHYRVGASNDSQPRSPEEQSQTHRFEAASDPISPTQPRQKVKAKPRPPKMPPPKRPPQAHQERTREPPWITPEERTDTPASSNAAPTHLDAGTASQQHPNTQLFTDDAHRDRASDIFSSPWTRPNVRRRPASEQSTGSDGNARPTTGRPRKARNANNTPSRSNRSPYTSSDDRSSRDRPLSGRSPTHPPTDGSADGDSSHWRWLHSNFSNTPPDQRFAALEEPELIPDRHVPPEYFTTKAKMLRNVRQKSDIADHIGRTANFIQKHKGPNHVSSSEDSLDEMETLEAISIGIPFGRSLPQTEHFRKFLEEDTVRHYAAMWKYGVESFEGYSERVVGVPDPRSMTIPVHGQSWASVHRGMQILTQERQERQLARERSENSDNYDTQSAEEDAENPPPYRPATVRRHGKFVLPASEYFTDNSETDEESFRRLTSGPGHATGKWLNGAWITAKERNWKSRVIWRTDKDKEDPVDVLLDSVEWENAERRHRAA